LNRENLESSARSILARVAEPSSETEPPSNIARLIDQTLLHADATTSDIEGLCREALDYGFAAVFLNPVFVEQAAGQLKGSEVAVGTVAGFPLGADLPAVKASEAMQGIAAGAREIDMVMNVGAMKGGDHDLVEKDIAGVASACHELDALLKVIVETAFLSDQEKVMAALLAREAGADFVKTSTGFASAGANTRDIAILRAAVGDTMGVKASGGIRTYSQAVAMIRAGATRIGTSTGVRIVEGAKAGAEER
jgi:deoxyribose-phosphate aldolase